MELLKFFLVLFSSKSVYCFNFDMDFPIIFEQPAKSEQKSYFGYAVAMYHGNMYSSDEWIRIGAPRANDTGYKIMEPGMLYNCQVNKGCAPISFINSIQNEASWTKGWVGATMDVSYKFERHVVCGFHQYYIINGDYRTMGSCYWSFLNSSSFKRIKKLLDPAESVEYSGGKPSLYLYGQGEAGFSVHFPEKENELILGAPGVLNWAGTPLRVTDTTYFSPDPNKRRKREKEVIPLETVEVPTSTAYNAFKLYGYSVTSGYYYGKRDLYYATGSPRENTYQGRVVIFKFSGNKKLIQQKENKIGEQFGEYFGASLASGDINNDNFDDLIIGAPFYKDSTYNEGRIYTFLGTKDNLRKPTIINGQSKNGQFGTAIMFLGDIDSDGYGEVAVGSPYENDNTGSVYIYKGTADGLKTKPCQTIIGKDVYKDLLGFGITISRAVDIDKNGFKDITIGSHLSGHAVLIRSRPIVAIKYTFLPIPKILQSDTRSFNISVCFSYSLFKEEDSVDIKYSISMDETFGRAFIGSNKTIDTKLTLYKDKTQCEDIAVTIQTATVDIQMPIKASLKYALDSPQMGRSVIFASSKVHKEDKFCIRCPVLDNDKSNSTFFETEIPFSLGCASNKECLSELNIDIVFPQLKDNTLLIGSKPYLKMKAIVKNLGENAYSTKLYITFQNHIYLRQTPPRCKSVDSFVILCDIANPLRNNTEKSIDFDLDIKNFDQEFFVDRIQIHAKVITTSVNKNNGTVRTTLNLNREADITIYGKAEQEMNYYGNSSFNSSRLIHTYMVEKFGVSPLKRVQVKLRVPYKYQTKEQQIQFLTVSHLEALIGGQPFTCNIIGVDEEKIDEKLGLLENVPAKRKKRQVEIFQNISENNEKEEIRINDKEVVIAANKTLYLNCSTDGVTCFDVLCSFGLYDQENNPASIIMKMNINISGLADFAKDADAVLISTSGEVIIDLPKNFKQNGNRTDSTIISSILLNDNTKQINLAFWIIILAAIIGFILLSILILALVKVGFFKRSKKEELKNLIAAATQEPKILEIIDYNNDDEPCEQNATNEEDNLQPNFSEKTNSSQEQLVDN